MTMPHLMNCDHSEDGWCLDCVKALWDKQQATDLPLFQHTEAELRFVSGILAALNSEIGRSKSCGVHGVLELFWADEPMGTIELDDEEDLASWVYLPKASRG